MKKLTKVLGIIVIVATAIELVLKIELFKKYATVE